MHVVALKLAFLAVLLVPVAAAAAGVWRRRWPGASASEVVLASLVCVPAVLLLEIVGLDFVPVHRPLDHLLVAHLGVSAAGLALVWVRRRELGELWREVRAGVRGAWGELAWVGRGVVVLGVATHAVATGYGAWNGPWTVDEKAYHIPQALQPYQDGRLGPVQVNVEWADSHPRGAALLYFWTLRLSGTDAGMHPVNAVFGWVLLLATYVAARRCGLGRGWAAAAAGIVPVSPIMFYLATVGNIDLSVSGLLGCAVAMALPRRGSAGETRETAGVQWDWGSCIVMLLALLLALWMKLTPLPLALLLIGIRGLERVWTLWLAGVRGGRPGPMGLGAAGLVMFALAAVPYAQTWERYGTPTYPFTLRIGPVVVFKGPMDIAAMMNRGTALSLPERFWTYWTPQLGEIGTEGPGTLGPVFAIAMVPAALACGLGWWWGRGGAGMKFAWLVIAASFWCVLVIPEHHVPRYAVWTLLPGAVCVMRLGAALAGGGAREGEGAALARSWCLALLALQVAGGWVIARTFVPGVRWQIGVGVPLLTEHRNRPVIDLVDRFSERTPTPATRRKLYELMEDGETLVTAVDGLMALFWDPELRYRVEHRPARRWPFPWPDPPKAEYGEADAPAWLEGLKRDGVAAAMVYRDSAEDRVLREAGSGYTLVYEQPEADAAEWVVRIYRREQMTQGEDRGLR